MTIHVPNRHEFFNIPLCITSNTPNVPTRGGWTRKDLAAGVAATDGSQDTTLPDSTVKGDSHQVCSLYHLSW